MNAIAFSLGLLLAAGAAQVDIDQAAVEEAIRTDFVDGWQVQQVQLAPRADGHLVGFAVARDGSGFQARFNCRTEPSDDGGNQWTCHQNVDAQVIAQMEANIRETLSEQGNVLQVALRREDDDRMRGRARLRLPNGTEAGANCTAVRDRFGSTTFNWECLPD
jgi:hypothetical protein